MSAENTQKRRYLWILGAVIVLFAVAFVVAMKVHREAMKDQLVRATEQEAEYTFKNLEDRLLFLAEHLQEGHSGGSSLEQEDFSALAHHLVTADDFIATINYIGADRRIQYTYPPEKRQKLVGLKIELRQPEEALNQAASSGDPRLSGPFEIIQGNTGYSLMVPSDESGFYEVVFRTKDVFDKNSRFRQRTNIAVSIRDGEALAYESPDYRKLVENAGHSTVSRKVVVLNRELTFHAAATQELIGRLALFWETMAWASGGVVFLLLGGMILLQARWARQHEAVRTRLRKSEEWHRQLFESSRDAIMTIEPPSLNFTSANAAAIKMFGAADEAEFLSLSVGELSPPRQPDGTPTPQKMEETLQIVLQEGSHFFEWAHCRRNGEVFPATVLLTKLHFGDRTIIQATVRDITERKEAERKLEEANAKLNELSMTDQLTGLPNRRQLDQKINEEITRSKRTGKGLAVLMLDLDHFKQVNDQYGHQKGDEILQQFAEILRQEVRDMDLPTRFGGEEFCVLLPEIEADEGRNVAERIRAAAELLSDPAPTVSVGVGYWEADMSSGGVLRRADRALYAAKEAGRNCVVTYCKQPGKGAQNLSDSE